VHQRPLRPLDAQILALEVVGVNGRVISSAVSRRARAKCPLDTNLVHYKQITITGTSRQSLIQYRQTLALGCLGTARREGLVTMSSPLGPDPRLLRTRSWPARD